MHDDAKHQVRTEVFGHPPNVFERRHTRGFSPGVDYARLFLFWNHVRNRRDDRIARWRSCWPAESRPRLRPSRDLRAAISLVRASPNGEEQGDPRTVAMSEALSALLNEYLATWKPNPAGFLFLNRNGRPYAANKVVEYGLWPVLDKLGIERAGMHGSHSQFRWMHLLRWICA